MPLVSLPVRWSFFKTIATDNPCQIFFLSVPADIFISLITLRYAFAGTTFCKILISSMVMVLISSNNPLIVLSSDSAFLAGD